MDLEPALFATILQTNNITVHIGENNSSLETLFSQQCYQVLADIQKVLAGTQLDDPTCFAKIEEIGSHGGGRHNFWYCNIYFPIFWNFPLTLSPI